VIVKVPLAVTVPVFPQVVGTPSALNRVTAVPSELTSKSTVPPVSAVPV
jgi:hypothetical protein